MHDLSLDDDIRYLKGVGEKRAELFYKLGVSTVGALLRFYPRKYADYSRIVPVSDASIGDSCTVKVTIGRRYTPVRTRSGRTMFRLEAYDDSDAIEIVFFNNRFGPQGLETGSEAVLYGRISGTMLRKQIINPIKVKDWEKSGLVPQYPQTAGLSSTYIAKTVRTALSTYGSQIRETLPSYILDEYMLEDLPGSIRNIHFPADAAAADLARRRLIFEELLVLQLGMSLLKRGNRSRNAPAFRDTDWKSFAGALPFELTNAQKRSIAEVAADLSRNEPMARLIQGDVGSGKTVVAAAAAFLARANGYQCAVMAPTELLAKQHAETFQNLLGQFGVNIALLTGSVKGKKRDVLLENLRNGSVDLLVGTHALISDEVEFSDLGVVVVDEQHRFGVEQRSRLGEKGMHPHVLVMSATPIPRTLALMIYGDLDVSIIDEMPPGRKPVKTYFVNSSMRSRYLGFVRKQADEGHQSYIVCPLVEESEALEGTLSATEYFEELKNGPLSSLRLGLIHGRMKPEAKEKVMGRFVSGELDVLVSTTVIGVGVDNPRATLMLIENAERFGLSDLHQLRGRVGRGDSQSYCVLVSDAKDGPAAERLKMLTKTSSGFEVAKYDLATRGPGDFLGKRQHGLPELAIADLVSDEQPLYNSQKAAESILKNDPDLAGPEHEGLRKEVADMFRSKETAMN